MGKFPKIICTSVIRSVSQGESHGGVYVVDLDSEETKQVIDWDDVNINWEGRGADRGLRGIDFYNGEIIIAASDEIFFFDQQFKIQSSYRNKYLRHCHELQIVGDLLYLSSTGFNSVLIFDLKQRKFIKGHAVKYRKGLGRINKYIKKYSKESQLVAYTAFAFDPNSDTGGPQEGDVLHINNVRVFDGKIYVSGTKFNSLLEVRETGVVKTLKIPYGTHNVTPLPEKIIFSDTASDYVGVMNYTGDYKRKFSVIKFPPEELTNSDVPKDHARQGFARGLTLFEGRYLIGGSSPSTISIYDLESESNEAVKVVNITKDIRNSIHGLEIYPYAQ